MRATEGLLIPRSRLLALAVLLSLGGSAWVTPGFAQTRIGSTLVLNGTSAAPSTPVTAARFIDAALDTTNNVYLVVFGTFGTVYGRFVALDGMPIGPGPFPIPTTTEYTDQPRVAASTDAGVFLVVWNDSRAGVRVYGRVVSYDVSGVPSFPATDFAVSPGPVLYTTSPSIAFSSASRAFLVAYTVNYDIRGRRIDVSGGLLGSEILITNSTDGGETDPDIAYNSLADEFYVSWRWWLEPGPLAGVGGRRVTAATGGLPDATWLDIDSSPTDDYGPAAPAFDRDNNRYLVAWYRGYCSGGCSPVTFGRFVNANGTAAGSRFTIAPNGTHVAIGLARNPLTGTFLAGFTHHDLPDIYGAEVTAAGTPGTMMALTNTGGSAPLGIDYARVTSHASQAEWLVNAVILWNSPVGQLIASAYPGVSFGKTSPVSGTADLGTTVTLSWQAATGATRYDVCVDTTNDNSCNTSWQSAGTATTFDYTAPAAGTYYWQARATVSDRTIEADSASGWWNFTVGAPPPAPVFGKTSPVTGTSGSNTSVALTWGAVTSAGFEVCVDATNDNSCDTSWQWNGTSTTRSLSSVPTGTYYWQVRAVTAATTEANGGTWWSFTVTPPPAAFYKTAPASGATDVTIRPTFSWTAAAGGPSYSICVNTVSGTCAGGPFMSNWTTVGYGTSWQPSFNFSPGTYYWQARFVVGQTPTGADNNEWFSFTVPPPTFAKTSPANGASGLGNAVTLTWSALSGLTGYYQLCVDSTSDTSCDSSGPTGGWKTMSTLTSWNLNDLANGTYYWHVRASSPATESNGGTWWSFTVGSAPLPAFTDDPLTAGSTTVKAVHITELRQRIDTLRTRYSLTAVSWTDATLVAGVTLIKGVHLTELRTALNAAYVAAGQTPPAYSDPTIVAGLTVVTATHIAELRAAIASIW